MADRLLTDSVVYKRLVASSSRPALVAVLGDSQVVNGQYNTDAQTRGYYANGFASEFRSLAMGRVTVPIEYYKGVGGQDTNQIFARIDSDILTLNPLPDICLIFAGSNPASANTWGNIATGIKKLTEAGILPIIFAAIPRASQTAALRSTQLATTRWLRQMQTGRKDLLAAYGLTAANPFLVADASRYIQDNSDTSTGDPLTGMLADGLHTAPPGAFLMGREGVRELVKVFGTAPPFVRDLRDTFIAGNPGDNLVDVNGSLLDPNLSIMRGTAGVISTDVTAGSTLTNNGLSTGLTYRRFAGNSTSAVTLSKVAKLDPGISGTRQRIDIAVSAAAATSPQAIDQYRLAFTIPVTNLVAGDYVCAEVETDIISNTKIRSIELVIASGVDGRQTGLNLTPIAHTRLLRTPPILVPATPVAIQGSVSVYIEGVAGAQASVCFDGLIAYKCSALG